MARILNHYLLQELTGNVISGMVLTANQSCRTAAVKTERRVGDAALYLACAGTTDVYYQVAHYDANSGSWSEPTMLGGVGANMGTILSGTVVASQFVALTGQVIAPWTRFVFVGQGTPTITAHYFQLEDV